MTYLPNHVNAEIKSLQVGHAKEGARHKLTDEIATQVQIFKGSQDRKVNRLYVL